MEGAIYSLIKNARRQGRKLLFLLVDPDKYDARMIKEASNVDLILLGGSFLVRGSMVDTFLSIRRLTEIPVVIFPGSTDQVIPGPEGILFLSLLSGRNAEYLIGQQVKSAMTIKDIGMECIPTGYILIGGEQVSATQAVTQTTPIPRSEVELTVATAVAGTMLGMKLIYLEAGSGSQKAVEKKMIQAVRSEINVPLLVGGGIDTEEKALAAYAAGADAIIIGNAAERDPSLPGRIKKELRKFLS